MFYSWFGYCYHYLLPSDWRPFVLIDFNILSLLRTRRIMSTIIFVRWKQEPVIDLFRTSILTCSQACVKAHEKRKKRILSSTWFYKLLPLILRMSNSTPLVRGKAITCSFFFRFLFLFFFSYFLFLVMRRGIFNYIIHSSWKKKYKKKNDPERRRKWRDLVQCKVEKGEKGF